jgi:hypothetical protein
LAYPPDVETKERFTMAKSQREMLEEILGVRIPEGAEFEIHIRPGKELSAKELSSAVGGNRGLGSTGYTPPVNVPPRDGFAAAIRFTVPEGPGGKIVGEGPASW